jgi:hypothetical protein
MSLYSFAEYLSVPLMNSLNISSSLIHEFLIETILFAQWACLRDPALNLMSCCQYLWIVQEGVGGEFLSGFAIPSR